MTEQLSEARRLVENVIPPQRDNIRAGLAALGSHEDVGEVVRLVLDMRDSTPLTGMPQWREIGRQAGLEPGEVIGAGTLVTVIATLFTSVDLDPETAYDVISDPELGLLDGASAEQERAARAIVDELAGMREEVSRKVVHAALARRALPLAWDVDFDIDVRLSFRDGEVFTGLPVVIAEIETTASDERFRFQMTEEQVESLVRRLEGELNDLRSTRRWLGAFQSKGGGSDG